MKNGQAERRSYKTCDFTVFNGYLNGEIKSECSMRRQNSVPPASRVKESNFVHPDIGNVTEVMANDGDVGDLLETMEIFSR